MTTRAASTFRGEVPLLEAHLLQENASRSAVNTRLFTGNLTPFRRFSLKKTLANAGPVRSIALLDNYWISFDQQVDIARGIIPGDTTFRTYITGLDLPRYTNLDLATGVPNGSAAEPYPAQTRPIGVPEPDAVPTLVVGIDPTPTTFSVDIFDPCDDLVTAWTVTPQINAGDTQSLVTQNNANGNPAPSFQTQAQNNFGAPAAATRDFGTATASVVRASWDVRPVDGGGGAGVDAGFLFAAGTAGDGARIVIGGILGGGGQLRINMGSALSDGAGSVLNSVAVPEWNVGSWFTVQAQMISNVDGTQTITAQISLGSAQLASVQTTNVFTRGGLFGPINAKADDMETVWYDNILVQASGSNGAVITQLATSYVYTFVNDLGEESAPSLPSATITRPDGVSVTVTTPTSEPTGVSTDYNIVSKRIYRAATGSSSTAFRFVAEIPLDQPTYVDVLTDTQLGEVLESDDWALPPDDLRGILALPNGVMVGFRRNQLCLSAQNHPHAWPVEYRLNTDTDIVGIGNIDTTVVIGTESFVYVASGNDPANYSMSKFEVPHAASSKQSFAYITGLGVVFSGPQGLMVCTGSNDVRNLTESVFTLRQWEALDPSSIVSVAHNDVYYMLWEAGSARGCYAVDLRSNGFGVVEMPFHASAAYVDPIADAMHLVLDDYFEPDDPLLPHRAVSPGSINAKTIYEFEGDASGYMNYSWKSKLWLEPYPAWHPIAQVRAQTYDNTLFRIYGDGVLLDEIVVDGEVEFTTTPPDAAYRRFQIEILGTDNVELLQVADDVTELS